MNELFLLASTFPSLAIAVFWGVSHLEYAAIVNFIPIKTSHQWEHCVSSFVHSEIHILHSQSTESCGNVENTMVVDTIMFPAFLELLISQGQQTAIYTLCNLVLSNFK